MMIITDAYDGVGKQLRVSYAPPKHGSDVHRLRVWKKDVSNDPTAVGEHVMDLNFTEADLAELAKHLPLPPARPKLAGARKRV